MVTAISIVQLYCLASINQEFFFAAKPVWLEGRETEMNVFAGFRAPFYYHGEGEVQVRIAAATLYRMFVNGQFIGHGPARGPHGWFRVDTWEISKYLVSGDNVVALEVAGYNSNSYYVLDQPSFIQFEVTSKAGVVCASGTEFGSFEGFPLTYRLQKVQRYSFQRPFIEAYVIQPDYDVWRRQVACPITPVKLTHTDSKKLLPRGVAYPSFGLHPVKHWLSTGTFSIGPIKNRFRDRSLVNIGPSLKGFPEKELELAVSDLLCATETTNVSPIATPLGKPLAIPLTTGTFHVLDLGVNLSGFIQCTISCTEAMRLILTFDETQESLDVNWRRLGCVNAVLYDLAPGQYVLESFEPYTFRYIKLMALSGSGEIVDAGIRAYEHPDAGRAEFQCANPSLTRIFEAGRTTFAQNAVDIFMDCPHRERAGWLCDSFFTARTEFYLTGSSAVERNFIENFQLPEKFAHLPEGMLPMCYPADHYDGVFIPNWALWFVLQLGEYVKRHGDETLIQALKPKIEALFNYFSKFENEFGLLERLESWVFIEWSEANKFVQDVNYPSNMLYARALEVAGSLYGQSQWKEKADALRSIIRKQAKRGKFFVDNAVRTGNELTPTANTTEVCQYFAFYFGVATPEQDAELWHILLDEFGPHRQEQGLYPEVHPANAFIGNMLRFELLSRAGRAQQIIQEMGDYLLYMVERTGTLWENQQDHASLNHGFASHACVTLLRDFLGVFSLELDKKRVVIKLHPLNVPYCSGKIPVGEGWLVVQWQHDEQSLMLFAKPPEGFQVQIENQTGKVLQKSDTPLTLPPN